MRDELLRILSKDGWSREDLEDLKIVFSGGIVDYIDSVEPDILEMGIKHLLRGKGSISKRLELSSRITGIPVTCMVEILHILNPRKYPFPDEDFARKVEKLGLERALENPMERKSKSEKNVDFQDILEKLQGLHPMDLSCELLEDAEIAYDISSSFKKALETSSIHPYIVSVVKSRKRSPLVVDGSNLLWKSDLDVSILDKLFEVLSYKTPVFHPIEFVFDANVRYVVPRLESKKLEKWLSKHGVYIHSPADELLIALAKQKEAYVMSSDRFRDYNTEGLKIVDFPRELFK